VSDSIRTDTVPFTQADTMTFPTDSMAIAYQDSLLAAQNNEDQPISDPIIYSATDSIDNDVVNKKVYLYGNAEVKFGTITLQAERIVYDFESYTVHAEGIQDSLGMWKGVPKFVDGASEFDAREMDYNFKTKQGYVTLVESEIIEGNLLGREVKTVEGGSVIYIRRAEYCPCDDPNAKTRFKIGKMKVIKDDKIVSGPGYLSFYGVPTPLAFPFGFFPNSEKRQAGIVVPSYGNGFERGYFLNDLGYYMPFGDHVDTKVLVDLYSRGSWGVRNMTQYNTRYKHNGSFDLQYNFFQTGDQDLGNLSQERSFFVTWVHTQDRKARPNSNFSADINAGSTNNFVNNLNSSQNDFLTNTFRSNIRYQKSFYDSPWNLQLNAGHNQNSQTGIFDFTLPELAINKARTFPLDGLFNDNPKQAWYEKIGWTYAGNFRNTLRVQESDIRMDNIDNLLDGFRNGIRHNVAVNTSLKAGPFSIVPSFSWNERWAFETYGRSFDPSSQEYVVDTLSGFARNGDWNLNASATTKIYGMYSFTGNGRLQAIRHTLTPTVSFSYRPDFDSREFGFYGTDARVGSFSRFDGTLFGGPPVGQQGLISVSLINNIEGKFLSKRDTSSKFTKVPIIENLTVNGSYNMAADSLNFSLIRMSGRTKVTKYAVLNFGSVFEPYAYAATGPNPRDFRRVNVLNVERGGPLATFESGFLQINATGISSTSFKKKKPVEDDIPEEDEFSSVEPERKSFFSNFEIPWNLTFGYTIDAVKGRFVVPIEEGFILGDSIAITQSIMMNGDVNIFNKVKVRFNTGYDFVLKELSTTTLVISVDLNCWELNARVVPFGVRRSYSLSLNIKSSMLRDLKFERNRTIGAEGFFL
jgi:lipopolysaccharide export system protein LptA